MELLLDAYNIIHKLPLFEQSLKKSLEASREHLVRVCRQVIEDPQIKKIQLVFDGSSEIYGKLKTGPEIKAVFTETGEDADDRILQIIKKSSNPKRFLVVSDDNYVYNNTKALGVQVISVGEFQSRWLVTKSKVTKSRKNTQQDLSEGQKNKITEEYKKILGL